MDETQLVEYISDLIRDYDVGSQIPESDVTAIADALLDAANKDIRHGFVRKSEAIIRNLNPLIGLDEEGNNMRPDKVVLQRNKIIGGSLIVLRRYRPERKVLVIECKSDHEYNDEAVDQIKAYMTLANFPNGLLLSQRRGRFFVKRPGQAISDVAEYNSLVAHLRQIIDTIVPM